MTWQNPTQPNSAAALYSLISQTQSVATLQNLSPITPVTITGTGETACDVSLWNGYELQFSAASVSTGPGSGMTITLKWYNNLTDTIPVDIVTWESVPIGNAGSPYQSNGHGPMRGLYMVLDIEGSPPPNNLYTLLLSGTTRTYSWDDWRSNGVQAGFSLSAATPWTNELCMVFNGNVGAGGNLSRGIFMYAGRAFFHMDSEAGVGTLVATISDFNENNIVADYAPGEGKALDEEIILPRGSCTLNVANTGGAAATCNIAIIADRV
jgi:hypothetical protein